MGREVCAPWVTPDQLCCEGDVTQADCAGVDAPLVFQWTDEEIILAASNILFGRTGRRYSGACTYQVWPCVDTCRSGCTWKCQWRCGRLGDRLVLPTSQPVLTAAVTVDDVPLNAALYVIEGNMLVRVDGERWPRQNYGVADVDGVDLKVTYTAGIVPPVELQMAAADLACELKKSCNGQECALDPRVTSFARRGVSVELTDLADMLKSGATGIQSVDYALSIHEVKRAAPTMHDPAAPARGIPVPPAP
jgi:hypothetical protein